METNTEDPKAVLDGVAVTSVVGIVRQLADLIEFAAEIFHGLHEQLLVTSSRSSKLFERLHSIESPHLTLEKTVLAQRSHLHFVYTPGLKWHTRIRTEENHFIYSDLPCCVMNLYEDCHDPPPLHKLDKFDINGPGSCFRRYSDPAYYNRSSAGPYESHPQKIETEPEVDHLTSSDLRNRPAYTKCISDPSYSTRSEEENVKEVSSSDSNVKSNFFHSNNGYLAENSRSKSTYVTWDETLDIIDYTGRPNEQPTEIPSTMEKMGTEVKEDLNTRVVDHIDFDFHDEQPHSTPVRSDVPESTSIEKGYQTITGIPFEEQSGNETPSISPSSPLLEHMRISLQPIDGFQTVNSNGLMFSSFQLVPEPSIWSHEFASDSDNDDTLCRSSSYASNSCHSHPSGSNSEQCDSSDSPRIKDHELDDEFGRISPAESVSSSLVSGIRFQQGSLHHKNHGYQSSFIEDGMQSSQHSLLSTITNSSSMEASQNQLTNGLVGPTPPPPPLPPMEWRGIKLNSEALTHPQSSKWAARKQENVVETDSLMLQQKSHNLTRVSTARLATSPAGDGPSSI